MPKPVKKPRKNNRGGARKGAGKPSIPEINWEEFEKLCHIQATTHEIGAWFGIGHDTVELQVREHYGATFTEVFQRYKGKGKVSLRRRQFQAALEGDTAMLIFLGKQYLEQADKKDITGTWKNPYEALTDDELRREEQRLAALAEPPKQIDVTPAAPPPDLEIEPSKVVAIVPRGDD
jgi:hypothetical protein